MQSGELWVVGKGSSTIPLRNFPSEVKVKFKHEGIEPPPCDPGNVDTIEYEVIPGATPSLVITWVVSSMREVVWHAFY